MKHEAETAGPLVSAEQIFFFDHPHEAPARGLESLLGGKGAGLAEMTRALGLPVPPGFTVALPVCRAYREGGWPADLDGALRASMAELGARMGRKFGDPADPLLVSVRSGAPVSMPGMLDTILNLGLTDETVLGLARASGDERFAWDTYRRFLAMYASIVLEVPGEAFPGFDDGTDASVSLPESVQRLKAHIEEVSGRQVPQDPYVQLHEAVKAVFCSWDSSRARAYRSAEGIQEDMGTAVNVQAMVFGNRGPESGTGVVFTRNPSTGHRQLYGDYLPRAQGEDVVAGTAKTLPVGYLAEHTPRAHRELMRALRALETHYRDMCDVEFTVEDGKLWVLQTRIGKRGAVAAVRCATHMVNDLHIGLTPEEAVARVPFEVRERARQEVLAAAEVSDASEPVLDVGLGASPGRVSGRVVLTADEAADAEDDVILVRPETSPEDVPAMAASVGVLTTRGGLVSHAAVVARGWGIPAVVGAHNLTITAEGFTNTSGVLVRAGDTITIDGATGRVWLGELQTTGSERASDQILDNELPELALLEQWAADLKNRKGTADA
ncbi:phosphate kinase [Intrasporangium chromatireducens Q5-1]|uniref:Phosphate kinase n=1 Tax=Intrasporangium chromatireducens Q5-1 TaxID=584657 RepID=W9GNJ1_9MICO|nr:pyruvate, phosphate dikinase [Intrasporangium chromatireducens]EWT06393.1 phosphate kinase [Intrasporangium chromatireducens Q5-1]